MGGGKGVCINYYATMIYTAQCLMFWMRAYPLRGQVGGGWALEFKSFFNFFGPCEMALSRKASAIWGPKNSRFPGPNPLPLAQIMDMHESKTLCTGCINHRCIGGFMHKSPRGRFQDPYWGGWRSRFIKELDRPARAAPPPPHYKTYQKSRDNCKVP